MQSLTVSGYTAAEVDAQFHSANVTLKFRYDLLTSTNAFKSPLTSVLSGSVANNSLANIKRTARFTMQDDGSVNFLSDRIKPYARLLMPDIKRMVDNDRKNSLSFDGVDDYVNLGSPTSLRITGDLTLETWVYLTGYDSNPALITWVNTPYTAFYYHWVIPTNGVMRFNDGTNSNDTTALVPLNAWTHLAITVSGATLSMYINGALDSTHTTANPRSAGDSFCSIGRSDAQFMKGFMRDARIWNIARTQAQIQANMNSQLVGNETGLVGYWRLNDGAGLTAHDYTSNANNGTLTNGPTWVTNGVITIPSSYAEFPLGVFVLSTPPRRTDANGVITREVEAYDLLQVLVDDKVTDRYTIASGANYISGTNGIKALLDSAGITSQNLTATTSTLPAARDWAPGTTKLQIINDLLGAINYRSLFFDENGVATAIPYQSPAARASEYTYIDDSLSVMFPEVEQALDLFGVANKWTLVVSEPDRTVLTSTYTNSNPSSQTSTVNRGRTIVDYRENQEAADQTTLDALAARIAFEASQVYETVTFETGIMPMHSDSDVYTLTFSTLGISAKYSEVSWEFELKSGSRMKHSIRKVVYV